MEKATALKPGDLCPNCGGAMIPALVPTAAMRRRAEDREQRVPYPPHYDTASEAQRAELGALHVCERGDYHTRFPIDAPAPEKSSKKADDDGAGRASVDASKPAKGKKKADE